MVLIRYILYFCGVALFTWVLTRIEIASPGGLKLQVFSSPADVLGTSEYSPIEMAQLGILTICGLLFAWVAQYCPAQRPVAFVFGGLAVMFFIRELDYFLDRFVIDNFWQVPTVVIASLIIVYTWRQRRRFRISWLRMWPSPGLTLIFAGALVHFAFVLTVVHEPLWKAMLGDDYRRIIKLAVEEFMELMGYYLWLIGTIEYLYQARALAQREPQTAAVKRRGSRQRGGRY
jgi:hypothetical protein